MRTRLEHIAGVLAAIGLSHRAPAAHSGTPSIAGRFPSEPPASPIRRLLPETGWSTGDPDLVISQTYRPKAPAVPVKRIAVPREPVAAAATPDGKLLEAAKRGEKLFKQAGCARCHPAPLHTDLGKSDVGTGTGREAKREFDTPTLVDIWRTAPFLCDGCAATMADVLTKFNANYKHGATSKLTGKEIADLVEFILSQQT